MLASLSRILCVQQEGAESRGGETLIMKRVFKIDFDSRDSVSAGIIRGDKPFDERRKKKEKKYA